MEDYFYRREAAGGEGKTHLGGNLGLVSLLCLIGSNALGLDALGLGILLLVIRAEEVDLIIILFSLLSCRCSSRAKEGLAGGARAREGPELSSVGFDVGVPTVHVGERSVRGSSNGLEDDNVGLGGGISVHRERS